MIPCRRQWHIGEMTTNSVNMDLGGYGWLNEEEAAHEPHAVAESALIRGEGIVAVRALWQAVQRAQRGDPTVLTAAHAPLLRVCLKVGTLHMAMRITDAIVLSVHPSANDRDVLLYLYYAGLAMIALTKWARALTFFRAALLLPTDRISAIQISSFKKLCLVVIIANDSRRTLEQISSSQANVLPIAQRLFEVCEVYTRLCRTWIASNASHDPGSKAGVAVKLQQWASEFDAHDRPLLQQVTKALVRQQILDLTRIYSTITLGDLAKKTRVNSLAVLEQIIVSMVDERLINARIDLVENVVYLIGASTCTFDDEQTAIDLEHRISQVGLLCRNYAQTSHQLSLEPAYLHKVQQHQEQNQTLNRDRA